VYHVFTRLHGHVSAHEVAAVSYPSTNNYYYYYYTHLTASFPGQPGSAGTRKVKPVWIYMRQEMMGFWDAVTWTNNNNNNDRLTAFDPGQPG